MPTCPRCGRDEIQHDQAWDEWRCPACRHTWRELSTSSLPDPRAPEPKHIFLSYAHDQHAPDARRIRDDLRRRGHHVWFDEERLIAGGLWESAIEEGLQACDLVVVLITPHTVRRRKRSDPKSSDGYCLNELAKAQEKNKAIIPVMLVALEDGLPQSICRIQYLDLTDTVPTTECQGKYCERFQRLVEAIEQDKLDFEGGHARLRRLLRPLDFSRQMAHAARFTGRRGLLSKVDEWLATPTASRVFWLQGKPGTGKTAIAAYLCHRWREVIAHHFCVHDDDDMARPELAILSLAYQLSTWSSEYYRRLQALDLESEVAKNPQTLFDRLVVRLLANDFPAPDGPRVVIIDGLDEATPVERGVRGSNAIAKLVAERWTDLPPWLRVFITSRPEAELVRELRRFDPFVLDAQEAENREDIGSFLKAELARREMPHDERTLASILDHSEGVFLYAAELMKEIDCARDRQEKLARLTDLPNGMRNLYTRFFERQMPDVEKYQKEIRPILQCIVAAREPVTLDLLNRATGMVKTDLSSRLASVCSLFPLRARRGEDSTVVCPRSVRDWLVEIDASTEQPCAGNYVVSLEEGNKQLADTCWKECARLVADGRPLPAASKPTYTCRHGVRHLVEAGQYAKAVNLLDYLNRNRERLDPVQRPTLDRFAKLVTSAMGACPPEPDEAAQVDPRKLARLIQGIYMTDPLYGGIQLILEHHPDAWPEIREQFLLTDDYVLRHTMAEVLADNFQKFEQPERLEEILGLLEHPDINHQELGGYSLGSVYARFPDRVDGHTLNLLAEGETYSFRSVLGDLLINLVLRDEDAGSSLGREKAAQVASSSRFFHPLWDFNRMDVAWLRAATCFVARKQPDGDAAQTVHDAHRAMLKTETLRQQLLGKRGKELPEAAARSLDAYYRLGVAEEEIRGAERGLGHESVLRPWCEVLFAHPLWEVTEAAAAVLASIVDDNPNAGQIVRDFYGHELWRVRFGAAETAFLARFSDDNQLFRQAIAHFYGAPEPLLRGNCAENLTAWILDSHPAEQDRLLVEFEAPLRHWISNEAEDCWVLDHVHRLARKLWNAEHQRARELLVSIGPSSLLQGPTPWYQLDRKAFLSRIEMRKRELSG